MERALVICDRCGAHDVRQGAALPPGWEEMAYPIVLESDRPERADLFVMFRTRTGQFCPVCVTMMEAAWKAWVAEIHRAVQERFSMQGAARFEAEWGRTHGRAVVDGSES